MWDGTLPHGSKTPQPTQHLNQCKKKLFPTVLGVPARPLTSLLHFLPPVYYRDLTDKSGLADDRGLLLYHGSFQTIRLFPLRLSQAQLLKLLVKY